MDRPEEIELAMQRTSRALMELSSAPYAMPWDPAADFGKLRAYIRQLEQALAPFGRMGALAEFYIEEACPGVCWPTGKTDPDGPPSQAVGAHEMIFALRALRNIAKDRVE